MRKKLKRFADSSQFKIFLQPKGPDSVYLLYPKDTSEFLSYSLPRYNITFQFHPTDFTQVNATLNRKMVQHAIELLELKLKTMYWIYFVDS